MGFGGGAGGWDFRLGLESNNLYCGIDIYPKDTDPQFVL